jgi:phosphotransferase system enzyme I (PtsI)
METAAHGKRTKLSVSEEQLALECAISKALNDIAELMKSQTGDGLEILEFQQALLEDEVLTESAWPMIAAGVSCDDAWRSALDSETAQYKSMNDEHFSSRVADLNDIRDRVLSQLFEAGTASPFAAGDILVAEDIAPSNFLSKDWSNGGALVLGAGSPHSHVAMLARSRSIPMVVGIGDCWRNLSGQIMVNGDEAVVTLNPQPHTILAAAKQTSVAASIEKIAADRSSDNAKTADGIEIAILINVAKLGDVTNLSSTCCDGIGLARTEFLVEDVMGDEEQQFQRYAQLLRWADGKPVTIRTVDAGGDKPVSSYAIESEANPFMGMRGIRLSLANVDIFKIQLRALLRAAAVGPLKVLLPMITNPADLETTRNLMKACRAELTHEGTHCAWPQLGIMVEVPAVALAPHLFDADFFSIGTNDLTQYATAAARDNYAVAKYVDTMHAGVLFMIENVVLHGHKTGKEVGLCGDASADPLMIPGLIKAGIRSFSVPPGLVAATKAAIAKAKLSAGDTCND